MQFARLSSITSSPIVGNKNTVRQNYSVTNSFDEIHVNGVIDYQLLQRADYPKEELIVETDSNLQDYIVINIKNAHILNIGLNTSFIYQQPLKIIVHVTFRQLNKLQVDGTGSVQSINPMRQSNNSEFVLIKKGTGNLHLILDIFRFQADLSGTGHIRLRGRVEQAASIVQSGVTSLDARDFLCKKMDIHSSGVSTAYVTVTDEINAEAIGLAKIYYKGNLNRKQIDGQSAIITPY
ncbi:unnamed protein product [Didymodactylos carnosus]|uniref:Putative auto-transporter adhesin head GIN domain-containing protein n=1 Tax=Didymodactylos carnosus TaxID=1234261 RepID=A0A814GDE5_9BILA|nr:unnamed protein product [Didymodactylos carnosus]CAF1141262.1 unnamed protein product [Didymodactylos carnosus]CAF3765872.1 unnamed protein product [Didymodactylos carnosus]CAF3936993.1 unnamed protein product [Didymodactylos carnosus]